MSRRYDGQRAAALALAIAIFGAGGACAQSATDGPITTASAAAAPPATATPGPLGPQPIEADDDSADAPLRDGKIHGMVEAGVGTNGYRHGAAVIDAPLPQGGEVVIAVQSDQIQTGRGRRGEN
jgi:hypothetical protein